MFKLLLDWRTDAHKGKTQDQLTSEYATTIEKIRPPAGPSNRGSSSSGSTASGETTTTATSSSSGGSSNQQGDNTPARKRIRLQKSRRVVTERAA